MPTKKANATDTRIIPVLTFLALSPLACWSSMTQNHCRHAVHDHFTVGGVSKLWYGAGVGRWVHSSESAPSHGFCGAFSPLRIHFTTMYRKSNCVRPKPNAPIDEIMLKSV